MNIPIVLGEKAPDKRNLWLNKGILKYFSPSGWQAVNEDMNDDGTSDLEALSSKVNNLPESVNGIISEYDESSGLNNIQTYIVVPAEVMGLSSSGTSSEDCVAAFGGEEAFSNWITEVFGDKEIRIVLEDTIIYNTNITHVINEDLSVYINIDYITDESIRSLTVEISSSEEVSIIHSTASGSSSGYTAWIRGSLYLATTSTINTELNYYLGGDDNISNIINCIDNTGVIMLNNAMEDDIYASAIEYVTYNWSDTNRIVGFKIPLESGNNLREIKVNMTDTSALSVTAVTDTILDSSLHTYSPNILDIDEITNENGIYSTISSTDGTFPDEVTSNITKRGVFKRTVNTSDDSSIEGVDIFIPTTSSMSNYIYYRRFSGTDVASVTLTSWFRLLDTNTPDVMHASNIPLTDVNAHLKSGIYAIDDGLTVEGIASGYGIMRVEMENYTNNTGVRTITMITGNDAGKIFSSNVLTGTYDAFTQACVDINTYNALAARVLALES